MLQNFSSEVRHCMQNAEDCAERARCEPNPSLQRDFFDMEQRWLKLARSYQLAEQLQTFTSHNDQQRGELTRRLQELKQKVERRPSPSIARFVQISGAFDPEALEILGTAFDMACAVLDRTPQPTVIRQAIAKNIVEAAKQGERDPHRLRDAGLAAVERQVGLTGRNVKR